MTCAGWGEVCVADGGGCDGGVAQRPCVQVILNVGCVLGVRVSVYLLCLSMCVDFALHVGLGAELGVRVRQTDRYRRGVAGVGYNAEAAIGRACRHEASYHQEIICMPEGATHTKAVGLQRAWNLLLMTDWRGARGASVPRAVQRLTGRGQVSYMLLWRAGRLGRRRVTPSTPLRTT